MEYYTNGDGFLEELLSLNHENEMDMNNNSFSIPTNNTFFEDQSLNLSFLDELSPPPQILPNHYYQLQDCYSMSFLDDQNLDPCKVEPEPEMPVFNMGYYPEESERKKKTKVNGPSKNLMAERRRRKRLNDRLSMLRSVVPKISSKMDRTSILGDTIDYMKELLERINALQEELNIHVICKPKEISFTNSPPKFDVERRDSETRIEIGCGGGKPGLLVSTVNTIEALGLEIQHCVISCCFTDFAMQASCTSQQELNKQREIMDSEGIKQALVRNAGGYNLS